MLRANEVTTPMGHDKRIYDINRRWLETKTQLIILYILLFLVNYMLLLDITAFSIRISRYNRHCKIRLFRKHQGIHEM